MIFYTLLRKRPLLFLVGHIVRTCEFVKKSIPHEAYTLVLLWRFLAKNGGSITSLDKEILQICVPIKGKEFRIKIRTDSSDVLSFEEVFISRDYLRIVELLQCEQNSPKLIVDAGANIGLSTLFFKAYFPSTKIICIEPDSQNAMLLHQNIDNNDSSGNNKILLNALWCRDTKLDLLHDFRDGLAWSIRVVEKEDGAISGISVISLLSHCQGQTIDLFKMDIEGSEFEVLRQPGIDVLLKQTRHIVIEVHPEFGDYQEIQDILVHFGFSCFWYGALCAGKNQNL